MQVNISRAARGVHCEPSQGPRERWAWVHERTCAVSNAAAEAHLGVLLVRAVHDRAAADLGELAAARVELYAAAMYL